MVDDLIFEQWLFQIVFLSKGIVCSAYSPIGAPNRPANIKDPSQPILLDNDVIRSIAEKHKATPAQVRGPLHGDPA